MNTRLQDLPFEAVAITLQHGAARSYDQSPIVNNLLRGYYLKEDEGVMKLV